VIFQKEKLPSNKYLNWALGGSFALQIAAMTIPGLRSLLGLTPIGLIDGLVIGASAFLPLMVNEATKSSEGAPAMHDVQAEFLPMRSNQ
jgi:Ca2+-transporting ATPase